MPGLSAPELLALGWSVATVDIRVPFLSPMQATQAKIWAGIIVCGLRQTSELSSINICTHCCPSRVSYLDDSSSKAWRWI